METKTYKPANGSQLTPEEAQTYGERLEWLTEEHGGFVTPAVVVEDAKDESSPTHDFFEWEDSVAANLHRLNQARYLLRTIHVVVKTNDEDETARNWYNVTVNKPPEKRERVYVAIERVKTEEELKEQVVEQALRQLITWKTKYKQYQEFSPIISAIEEVRNLFNSSIA